MEAYVPVIIWVLGAVICSLIARARNVKPTFPRNVVVLFLGPFAIPLVFLAKPEED
mgnify:FL=1